MRRYPDGFDFCATLQMRWPVLVGPSWVQNSSSHTIDYARTNWVAWHREDWESSCLDCKVIECREDNCMLHMSDRSIVRHHPFDIEKQVCIYMHDAWGVTTFSSFATKYAPCFFAYAHDSILPCLITFNVWKKKSNNAKIHHPFRVFRSNH